MKIVFENQISPGHYIPYYSFNIKDPCKDSMNFTSYILICSHLIHRNYINIKFHSIQTLEHVVIDSKIKL